VSQICSLICLPSIFTIRAPNSTPIVRSWTGWKRLSVNWSSKHDLPTAANSNQTKHYANFVRYSTSSFPFISRHRQIDLHKQKVLQLTTSTFIVHPLSSCMWQKNWQKLKWPIILPAQCYTSMGTNYGPVSVCLCLSQVSILSTGMNGLISFLHGGFFWPVIHSVIIIRKLKYLQN